MGKLPVRRSKTSERTPVQSARPGVAPSSAQRKLQPATASGPALQRAALLGHSVQRVSEGLVQAKLTLGPVGDSYEEEADSVARQVVGQLSSPAPAETAGETSAAPGPAAQRAPAVPKLEDEDDKLKMKPFPGAVQRVDEDMEKDLRLKPVQRSGEEDEVRASALPGAEGGPLGGHIERSIDSARSGGSPLDAGLRVQMEPAFGADFGGVRVHSDSKADTLNRSLQARAFTTGQDIFFRKGEYSPGSSSGKELVAHELTHVVQQNGPSVAKKPEV